MVQLYVAPVFNEIMPHIFFSHNQVAGGNGIGNQLNQLSFPWGIHVGKNGTIYIADSNNRRIQKWDRGKISFSLYNAYI